MDRFDADTKACVALKPPPDAHSHVFWAEVSLDVLRGSVFVPPRVVFVAFPQRSLLRKRGASCPLKSKKSLFANKRACLFDYERARVQRALGSRCGSGAISDAGVPFSVIATHFYLSFDQMV